MACRHEAAETGPVISAGRKNAKEPGMMPAAHCTWPTEKSGPAKPPDTPSQAFTGNKMLVYNGVL